MEVVTNLQPIVMDFVKSRITINIAKIVSICFFHKEKSGSLFFPPHRAIFVSSAV